MRPVYFGDIVTTARALMVAEEGARAALCAQIVTEADIADRYFKKLGHSHAQWGNGSLINAARKHPLAAAPGGADPVFCFCVQLVFDALLNWRNRVDRGAGA